MRALIAIGLSLGVVLGAVSLPAYGANSSIALKAKQSGQHVELSWSTRGNVPSKVSVVLRSGNISVAKLTANGATRKARFPSVNPGEYQVLLTSQKPKLSTSARVTVYGAPLVVSELTVLRQSSDIVVDWRLSGGTRFTEADSVLVVLRSAGKEVVNEVPASASNLRIAAPDLISKVEVVVTAKNRIGASPTRSGVVEADSTFRSVTEPRLVVQATAEDIFGSFAMINRSSLGPVDLSASNVGAENLVLKALNGCVTTREGAPVTTKGLVNIGAVLATRNATGTMILTSGATALADPVAAEWISNHHQLNDCVTPALVAQLRAVAMQLSSASTVDGVKFAPVDVSDLGNGARGMLVEGNVYLNGGASGEPGQPMQVLWITKGIEDTISQYILIRAGSAIDQGTLQRFFTSVAELNS